MSNEANSQRFPSAHVCRFLNLWIFDLFRIADFGFRICVRALSFFRRSCFVIRHCVWFAALLVGLTGLCAVAPSDELVPPTKPGLRKGKGYEMDYGSALSYTINCKVPG